MKTLNNYMVDIFNLFRENPSRTEVNIHRAERCVTLDGVLLAIVSWLTPDLPEPLLIGHITAN